MASKLPLLNRFGALPTGKSLQRIHASKNYTNGAFQNQIEKTFFYNWTFKDFWLPKDPNNRPDNPIPIIDTPISQLSLSQDLIIWLGHSSFYIQLSGKRILIDPVFSTHVSPVKFICPAFAGDYPYSAKDMPSIDYVLISHDHWDHLDYHTILGLKEKTDCFIVPLGVEEHLNHWGVDPHKVKIADWYDSFSLDNINIHFCPARHFSGRWLDRNQSLWGSFFIQSNLHTIFYSGDTGYAPHFKEINQRFGNVDLALIENGQYDSRWPETHMLPEQAFKASQDLNAKALLPAHSGRFSLSRHAWYEPYEQIEKQAQSSPTQLWTPKIGQVIDLKTPPDFESWWKNI